MNKLQKVHIGIDISKESFDVVVLATSHIRSDLSAQLG